MDTANESELGGYHYSPDENERITRNLAEVTRDAQRGSFATWALDRQLLCALHHRVFGGVRGHAGRHRAHDFGSEVLTFGPNRSTHRRDVHAELEGIFKQLRSVVLSLESNREHEDFEERALDTAVWAHARIVQVHPFEDGNGRSSRLLMAVLLHRFGFPDIPVEACKQEYTDVLNHYFRTNDRRPLVDLFLRIAPSVI